MRNTWRREVEAEMTKTACIFKQVETKIRNCVRWKGVVNGLCFANERNGLCQVVQVFLKVRYPVFETTQILYILHRTLVLHFRQICSHKHTLKTHIENIQSFYSSYAKAIHAYNPITPYYQLLIYTGEQTQCGVKTFIGAREIEPR